jgi:hypothetical protein
MRFENAADKIVQGLIQETLDAFTSFSTCKSVMVLWSVLHIQGTNSL